MEFSCFRHASKQNNSQIVWNSFWFVGKKKKEFSQEINKKLLINWPTKQKSFSLPKMSSSLSA